MTASCRVSVGRWLLVVLCGLVFCHSAFANEAPQVTNVVAEQRESSMIVDVTYDLYDADGDPLTVTLWLSEDGGATFPIECTTVVGDVGDGVSSGTGKHIEWDAGADYPGHQGEDYVVKVIADDHQGTPVPPGFVLIPAGTFTMGSPEDEYFHQSSETQHTVTLTTPFYVSATEVTNQQNAALAQWAYDQGYCTATSWGLQDALDGSTVELLDLDDGDCEISFSGGVFTVDPGKEDHPVLEVTWYGSVAYCDWLSLSEGLPRAYDHSTWECNGHDPYNAVGYRLLTEAEWEYACRAGTQTPFHTGECLDAGTEANYDGNYPYPDCPSGPYVGGTVPVGSYPANGFGLYDMHGNLYEWCNDRYGAYGGDEVDPPGPEAGSVRVIRGGFWYSYALSCRSANRVIYNPDSSNYYIGFRLARSAY